MYYVNIFEDVVCGIMVRRVIVIDFDFLILNKEIIYMLIGVDVKFYINRVIGL